MTPSDPLRETGRESAALSLQYEELRDAVAGKWDGTSSLHGLGVFMRAGMTSWLRRQLETGHWESATPSPRLSEAALPETLCDDVVGLLAEMALAAENTEVLR